ncbi:MAG: SDR family oxidoreductase [Fibrobacteria bacterium]|nr:SDR family oxidoreductase [Fibrobacteria bacterium]
MTSPPLALVTGSCVRTGKAIALELASRGWHVVVHGKPGALSEATETAAACRKAGGEASIALADLSTSGGREDLARSIPVGDLRLLVHNVGIYPRGSATSTSPETLSHLLATNLEAPWHLTNLLLDRLPRGGSVIALGYAGLQSLAGTRIAPAYVASKTALLVWIRSLALELGSRGIRVNMVSPGQLENSVDLPSDIGTRAPLGRAGSESDIARAVLWLASEDAAYITGQDLDVAGGLMLSLKG